MCLVKVACELLQIPITFLFILPPVVMTQRRTGADGRTSDGQTDDVAKESAVLRAEAICFLLLLVHISSKCFDT